MQTVIRQNYVAGLPGQLANLPSFKSSAQVISCRAGEDIPPGEPVILGSGIDSTVYKTQSAGSGTLAIGISVRSHSNMPTTPQFGSNTVDGVAGKNTPVGIVTSGPVFVKLASGQTPSIGDLALPFERDATTGVMKWSVAAAGGGDASRFRFASPALRGGVAVVMVIDGEPMSEGLTHEIPATGVTIAPTAPSGAPGTTVVLTATVAPSEANPAVSWTSSNESVATIDANGLVTIDPDTPVGTTTTITATTEDGGFTATAILTVTAAA